MSFYQAMAIIIMIAFGTVLALTLKRSNADLTNPLLWFASIVATVVAGLVWPLTVSAALIGGCIYFLYTRINKWLDSRGNKDVS